MKPEVLPFSGASVRGSFSLTSILYINIVRVWGKSSDFDISEPFVKPFPDVLQDDGVEQIRYAVKACRSQITTSQSSSTFSRTGGIL